jgi:signal transduction histidine kinase
MKNNATRNTSFWNSSEFISIFAQLSQITSLTNLELVLQKVISEIPDLLNASDCSVYLNPDIIPSFNEVLVRDGKPINYNNIAEELIVLAATSRQELQDIVGKAFYKSGEGITGWVYQKKMLINLKDAKDEQKLKSISKDLKWADLYGENMEQLKAGYRIPLLVVPLVVSERQLGVIKFTRKRSQFHFSELDEKIALLIGQITAQAIQNAAEINTQKATILSLMEIGARQNLEEIMIQASSGLRSILHSEKSHIYTPSSDDNSALVLWIENGKRQYIDHLWKRGHGFVGWSYKTGKSLVIEDTRQFIEEQELTDTDLEKISDSALVNQQDRKLQRQEPYAIPTQQHPITFLATPIKQDGEVLGVLSAQSRYGHSFSRSRPFNKLDLQIADSFARLISNAIESDQEKILNELLTAMGVTNDLQTLYSLVISRISKIVSSSGCSIFEFKKDEQGQYLKLVATSRMGWIKDGATIDLRYSLGEGKTGYSGLTKRTLIVNHYGAGDSSEEKMDGELKRIINKGTHDLVERLVDNNGIQVGIIQLKSSHSIEPELKQKFHLLRNTQKLTFHGLPYSKDKDENANHIDYSWSHVAIPIQAGADLMGLITLGRPVPENPFSPHDVTIIEAIAGRLATVIGNIQILKQREELFMSLAHEISTPLTGILAESENLMVELGSQSELSKLARDNLEQVLRLHLLTETIMGVLSNRAPVREFKIVNIGKVLFNACSIFEAEAAQKGCNILEPKPVEEAFPEIEMSEFDLSIALKNVIHNAVKYSFQQSPRQEKNRYVKIWGSYADFSRKLYRINVQNYGIGISKEEIENRRIFESYYRGINANDRRRTGAGFGLAYARRIIEDLHGGKIDVTSTPLAGDAYLTTFIVTLPIAQKTNPTRSRLP